MSWWNSSLFDPVMKICGFHECFYQVVNEGPAWHADKVKFPLQGEDSMLGG